MTEDPPTDGETELDDRSLAAAIRELAFPLIAGDLAGYDPLLDFISDARLVLIGDSSHGTHEFYRERALITSRLIRERGFNMVALEGDWPECLAVDAYLQGGPGTALDALGVFGNYPTWMWGNHDFLHFVEWLRGWNEGAPPARKVRLFGIDVRSPAEAGQMVLAYLDAVDARLADQLRGSVAALGGFTAGLRNAYKHQQDRGVAGRWNAEALAILELMMSQGHRLLTQSDPEAYFRALQAARVIFNGERFYDAVYREQRTESWNIRDTHMTDTLDALIQQFPTTRIVVWEHNTHIGDFRATDDAEGKINVGQLVRERRPGQSVAIGFGTYQGTVTATREWGQQPQHMTVPPGQDGSVDALLHLAGLERLLLLFDSHRERQLPRLFDGWRGQRAIGVVYNPDDESANYVPTRLARRYDAFVHIDRTRALRPLRDEPTWQSPESMDTYPTGY